MIFKSQLSKSKKSSLLLSILAFSGAALALFFFTLKTNRLDTLFLSFFGLACMGIALFLVISSSKQPLASIGVWFVAILALQHGLGWVLEQIFTDQHYTRVLTYTDQTLAKSLATAGIGLLIFAAVYAYFNFKWRQNGQPTDCIAQSRNPTIDDVPWWILIVWGAGFLLFEIMGGIQLFSALSTPIYLMRSIFGYLSKIALILISVKLLASRLKDWKVYALVGLFWAVFVFLTGQRQYIIGIGLATFVLTLKWRLTTFKVSRMIQMAIFILIVFIGMTYLRGVYGRAVFTEVSLSEQMAIMAEDESLGLNQGAFIDTLKYDLGYRLNAGNILLGLMTDLPGVDMFWIEPVTFSATSLVPNLIWSSKAQVVQHNMPRLISDHYKLSNKADYIVTYITVFYAMGGLPMVMFLCGLLGITVASLDIGLARNKTMLGLILAVGLSFGLLTIDHSIDLLFLSIRDALLLYFLVRLSMITKHSTRK